MDERDYAAMSQGKKVHLQGWKPIEELNHYNLVWLTDGQSVYLGCMTEPDSDGTWCWAIAESYNFHVNEDGRIEADCYIEDINPTLFQELPIIPLI
jgi:hypothetical protein